VIRQTLIGLRLDPASTRHTRTVLRPPDVK
jgi:hypothetical protein